MPLKARSESGLAAAVERNLVARPPATALVAVMPRRDPFAGGAVSIARPVTATTPPLVSMLGDAPPLAALPSAPPSIVPTRVTAVVAGARSFALVEDAGSTRVVTVGESLSGERIVAIGIDGVHLANGVTLAVTPSTARSTGVR